MLSSTKNHIEKGKNSGCYLLISKAGNVALPLSAQ